MKAGISAQIQPSRFSDPKKRKSTLGEKDRGRRKEIERDRERERKRDPCC